MRHDLVDEHVLLVHPLVMGVGRRLFADDGAYAALKVTDTKTTTTGVVIADSAGRGRRAGERVAPVHGGRRDFAGDRMRPRA